MPGKRTDYTAQVASGYDRRYRGGEPKGIAELLCRCAAQTRGSRGLEVGCGTGHWLRRVTGLGATIGVDLSPSMLGAARARCGDARLVAADAGQLAFPDGCFDLIWAVNAIHHFRDARIFLRESARLLAAGGLICVVGLDPPSDDTDWFVYEHFPASRRLDRDRYPAHHDLAGWMLEAGLEGARTETASHLQGEHVGAEVFDSPILTRYGTSQLCLLTDEEFAVGMASIRAAVKSDGQAAFRTDLRLLGTTASRLA